ncbi:hypothetical protein M758_9G189500 [Ceratodon purpureus]|uniref:Uncharacterized protein n=1 Tax=Ceratodon purpureus TaxID=3225 RepID=A0A8T0GWV8_CERPU|nr:hypothetical protein KC19_9G192000 [Ceratodon purpureus]KAG0607055.1 hypothetical protein M758_9G189500 [Ceratodon purpureus]
MAEAEAEGAYASQLHFAVKENDVERVRSLLQEGSSAKVTSRDAVGRTPLHWALVFGNDEAAKVLIINTPRRALDTRDQQGCTPLHYAAARAYATMARVLIERGASINAVDAKQRTPLHYAAQQTSPEMVELLVSRGAEKGLSNVQGELPLDVALKWGSLSSIPCLTPDPANTTTTTASDKQLVEIQKNTTVSSAPVEGKPSSRKGPSLEKLLSVWKAAETETRRKKEAKLAAAHKANAALEEALRAWREVEHANKPQRRSDEPSSNSDKASTSMSGSKSGVFTGLSVEIGNGPSSCDDDDSALTSRTQRRDLSWCTEWDVQECVSEEAQAQSPRERKLTSSALKEETHPWVQVPTYKQTLDISFDNTRILRRSNSFDRSHFTILVGGLATKLPFMSSLEVY